MLTIDEMRATKIALDLGQITPEYAGDFWNVLGPEKDKG